jgi:nucleotide-binding universal stress UspA family protein
MKRILFPTDFSETANNAFVYALEMAKFYDAEFIVLHVFDNPNPTYDGCPPEISEIYDAIELDNFENFRDQIPFLRKIAEEHHLENVKMSHVLKHGNLIKIIKEIVEVEQIDLIVMGNHGASGFQEAFIGSNAGYVITNVPVMVLCVPIEAKFKGIKNICFTTLFKEDDKKALFEVVAIANKFHANVKCLTVKTSHFKMTDTEIESWKSAFVNEPVIFYTIPSNDIKTVIYDFLDRQEIDVLAMLTRKRSFVEELFTNSLTQKLSYHSKVPILALHEKLKTETKTVNQKDFQLY